MLMKTTKPLNPKLQVLLNRVKNHLVNLTNSELDVFTTLIDHIAQRRGLSQGQFKLLRNIAHYPYYENIKLVAELKKHENYLNPRQKHLVDTFSEVYCIKKACAIRMLHKKIILDKNYSIIRDANNNCVS